jgi:hypothetical protein
MERGMGKGLEIGEEDNRAPNAEAEAEEEVQAEANVSDEDDEAIDDDPSVLKRAANDSVSAVVREGLSKDFASCSCAHSNFLFFFFF